VEEWSKPLEDAQRSDNNRDLGVIDTAASLAKLTEHATKAH
jgi:hypothetical protein